MNPNHSPVPISFVLEASLVRAGKLLKSGRWVRVGGPGAAGEMPWPQWLDRVRSFRRLEGQIGRIAAGGWGSC